MWKIPSSVDRRDVAGVQEAVLVQRRGRRLGVVEVLPHHVRPAHPQLAAGALLAGLRVDQLALDVRQRDADRAEVHVGPVVGHAVADRRELGHPVALQHRAVQPLAHGVAEVGVQRRGAGEDDVDAVDVVLLDHRVLRQRHRDRRGHVDPVDPVLRDDPQELREVELRHRHDGCPRVDALVHHAGHAVDVEERQDGQDLRRRRHVRPHRLHLQQVRDEVAVGQDDALGPPGGARGVGQRRHVVAGHRDRRALGRRRQQVGEGVLRHRRRRLVAGVVEQDDLGDGEALLAQRGAGAVEERRDRDEDLRAGVAQLEGELVGGVERVDRRDGDAGGQTAVEDHRVVRAVGREHGDDVALAQPALTERRGEAVDAVRELGEGHLLPARPVDHGDRVGVLREVGEQELGQPDVGDVEVVERAAHDHGRHSSMGRTPR